MTIAASSNVSTALQLALPNASEVIDSRTRTQLLARRLLRDAKWPSAIKSAFAQDSSVTHNASSVHPATREIAGLFALMQPHQRPSNKASLDALHMIETAVQILLSAISRGSTSSDGILTRSLTRRVLAPLYFPHQNSIWQELLEDAVANAIDTFVLYEINTHCGSELLPYLDANLTRSNSVQQVVERDFDFSFQKLAAEIRFSLAGDAGTNREPMQVPDLVWPVVWQWTNAEPLVAIPAALNCRAVDWLAIDQANKTISQLLASKHVRETKMGHDAVADAFRSQADTTSGVKLGDDKRCETLDETTSDVKSPAIPSDRNAAMDKREAAEEKPATTVKVDRSLDEVDSYLNELNFQVYAEDQASSESTKCEIRTHQDPMLLEGLANALDVCRCDKGVLSLLQIRAICLIDARPVVSVETVCDWHMRVLEAIKEDSNGEAKIAYLNSDGDLSIMISDLDRSELVRLVRESILSMEVSVATSDRTSIQCGFVCGVATVTKPHRGFTIQQLIDGADRCLDGALVQGRGAIKSLDVY